MDTELEHQSSISDCTEFSLPSKENSSNHILNLSKNSPTPSLEDYTNEFNFILHKVYRDFKFNEIEQQFVVQSSKNNNKELFECELFVKRLMQIFDELIGNLEYVMCLEHMLEDKALITKHLGCIKTEKLYNILTCLKNDESIAPNFKKITEILLNATSLKRETPLYLETINTNSNQFLMLIREFYRIMKIKCNMIAPKQMLKDKMFQEMHRNNQRICDRIKEVEEAIKREEIKMEEMLQLKMKTVNELQATLNEMKANLERTITEQIDASQRKMTEVYETNQVEQNQWIAKLNKARKQYNDALKGNLKIENEIRERKWLVQQQLRTWLNRYDKDIGERSAELEELQKRLSIKQKEFDEWHIGFKRQEEEYIALMKKKEMEEKKKNEEKLLLFLMNRSAIVIQRAWRRYLGRRKKHKKKGKKGKK